jgi:tripartite-type tricarboxylate transporter receptor subunit TctC
MREAGLPGYAPYTWYGFVVPSGTPADVVARISEGFNEAIADASVRARSDALGMRLIGGSPLDFQRHIRAEMDKWAAVIRKAGIKPDDP